MDDKKINLATLLAAAEIQGEFVLSSLKLKKTFELVQRIAPYNVTVLIQGESGTGKELVAAALHRMGPSPRGPFIALNCATLIGQLAESQLFGHIRGAFTDARDNALGYFRAAQGGTLFLDEVGELPLELQPKILRAVENREIQSVGSYQAVHVDARLVAATNRNLRSMVAAGKFREDLFYRLNAVTVTTSPLKDRRDGLAALAAHFAKLYSREIDKEITHISERALHILLEYDWPGNVRELSHAIRSAVLLADTTQIGVEDLPAYLSAVEGSVDYAGEAEAHVPRTTTILRESPDTDSEGSDPKLDSMTRSALLRSLEQTRGNRQQAAKILGISRQKLYRMIARLDLSDAGRQTH
jgi:DNA-binding NtrC family response regulator